MSQPGRYAQWIVSQIGARENYAIARALNRKTALGALITDAWVSKGEFLSHLSTRLSERNHPEIARDQVEAATLQAIGLEASFAMRRIKSWKATMRRNIWFQMFAAQKLRKLRMRASGPAPLVFSYSYGAARLFESARALGCRTVLGQIDPGPVEYRLVENLYKEAGQAGTFERVPESYWTDWRRELELSDRVIVNSEWSMEGLLREGVHASKIRVVPLAYERKRLHRQPSAPPRFSAERPLRLLFLGQVTLRKGVAPMLAAIQQLEHAPLQLDVVGPIQCTIPDSTVNDKRITFHGAVPRSQVGRFFEAADLFLFPTLSDGFGLTQLESLAAGLPVMASRFCGRVVEDNVTGVVLPEVTESSIAGCIDRVLCNPGLLKDWQTGILGTSAYGVDQLGDDLLGIGREFKDD